MYKEVVPKGRKPMFWEVQINGKSVGKLVPSKTDRLDVPIDTLPFYMKQKPPSVNEEVVTELTGKFELPSGIHEILLVYHNMIDGELQSISVE